MNSINKISTTIFILGFWCFSCYAQFNTVQSFSSSRRTEYTKNDSIRSSSLSDRGVVNMPLANPSRDSSAISAQDWVSLPLQKIKVNSGFGKRLHPITKKYKLHNGIDLRAKYEEVYSMLPGKIHKVGEDDISGKYIMVASGEFLISYCHLSKIEVRKGDLICAGERIGISGNTGRSSGAHLHITCRLNGVLQDPALLLHAIQKIKGATPS